MFPGYYRQTKVPGLEQTELCLCMTGREKENEPYIVEVLPELDFYCILQ